MLSMAAVAFVALIFIQSQVSRALPPRLGILAIHNLDFYTQDECGFWRDFLLRVYQ
jgi:hypothetical protein